MQETAQPSEISSSESAIATELMANVETTSIDKLKSMLQILGIDEVIYIDDYNNLNSLPIVLTTSKSLFLNNQFDDLKTIFDDHVNFQVPSEEELGQEINKYWDNINKEDQDKIFSSIINLGSEDFSRQDYDKTK